MHDEEPHTDKWRSFFIVCVNRNRRKLTQYLYILYIYINVDLKNTRKILEMKKVGRPAFYINVREKLISNPRGHTQQRVLKGFLFF